MNNKCQVYSCDNERYSVDEGIEAPHCVEHLKASDLVDYEFKRFVLEQLASMRKELAYINKKNKVCK